MRCREAKLWLAAQHEGETSQSDISLLQEHLRQCPVCHELELRQQRLDALLRSQQGLPAQSSLPVSSSISTERIMLAVQQQRRVTQQLEDIRTQQRSRIARFHIVGPSLAAIIFFTLGSIPLLFFAITIVQPDLGVNALSLVSDGLSVLVSLAPYIQSGMTVAAQNNWLLASAAFIFVVMMGMWLRLMRYPQEA